MEPAYQNWETYATLSWNQPSSDIQIDRAHEEADSRSERDRQGLDATQAIPVELLTLDLHEALRIAGRLEIYAYDAYFLECALSCRSPLLTLDRRLQAVVGEVGVETME